jgi:hypothetical protein
MEKDKYEPDWLKYIDMLGPKPARQFRDALKSKISRLETNFIIPMLCTEMDHLCIADHTGVQGRHHVAAKWLSGLPKADQLNRLRRYSYFTNTMVIPTLHAMTNRWTPNPMHRVTSGHPYVFTLEFDRADDLDFFQLQLS